jgi:hypothetical protein
VINSRRGPSIDKGTIVENGIILRANNYAHHELTESIKFILAVTKQLSCDIDKNERKRPKQH